jgi:hypothetical protein
MLAHPETQPNARPFRSPEEVAQDLSCLLFPEVARSSSLSSPPSASPAISLSLPASHINLMSSRYCS